MIRRVGTDREWQSVAIHDRHDFHAFSAPRRPNLLATALRRCERGVDEAFRLIDLALLAQSNVKCVLGASILLLSGCAELSGNDPSKSGPGCAGACATEYDQCTKAMAAFPRRARTGRPAGRRALGPAGASPPGAITGSATPPAPPAGSHEAPP